MAAVDWRQQNVLPDVVDQGTCNCCWAIVACNAISTAQTIIHRNPLTVYSYQQLIDCCEEEKWSKLEPEKEHECQTSSYRIAFGYLQEVGLCFGDKYKFEEKRNPCRDKVKFGDKPYHFNMLKEYVDLHNDREQVIGIIQRQPVAAWIHFTRSFRKFKGEGIYIRPAEELINRHTRKHAVLIIGYGEENGIEYFLIQNSWGEKWGDRGYARVGRQFLNRFCYPIVNDMREVMGETLFEEYFPQAAHA